MNASHRVRTIHLIDTIKRKPDYSKQIGLLSKDLISKKEKKNADNK